MGKNGFTLIELVIYLAALIIIVVFLTLFIFNFTKAQAEVRAKQEVLENSQRAMEIILGEIRKTQNIYQPTSRLGNHPGQLSLKTQNNPPQDETDTYLDFYLDGNSRLCLKKEGSSGQPLVSENIRINRLIFNLASTTQSRTIRVELSASYGQSSYPASTTLISSANFRND